KAYDEASLARAYQNLGVLACRKGEYGLSLERLEKAREIFVFFGSPFDRALNLLQLAWAQASVGRFPKAKEFLDQAAHQGERSRGYLKRKDEVEAQIALIKKGSLPRAALDFLKPGNKRDVEGPEEKLLRLDLEKNPKDLSEAKGLLRNIH